MKILLTGGAGFIGSHVADQLLREGHQVIIVDDLSSGKRENINPAATFYHMDIRDKALEDVFRREKPEVVDHHAAQINVRASVEDPLHDLEINIGGTVHLLELSRTYGVKKVVFASSGGAIYGEQDYFPADETHPCRPLSPYGVSKLTVENYLFYYGAAFALRSVALRYANVYGPRQDPLGEAGVIAIFSQKLLAGEQPIINGDGMQTRDYVYVEDIARLNALAVNKEVEGPFNAGTGIETSVNYLFEQIRTLADANVQEMHGKAKRGEQLRSVLCAEKSRRELGWEPRTSLSEGLRRTVSFFAGR
jgi:UDP-glucose 4-epimerase